MTTVSKALAVTVALAGSLSTTTAVTVVISVIRGNEDVHRASGEAARGRARKANGADLHSVNNRGGR